MIKRFYNPSSLEAFVQVFHHVLEYLRATKEGRVMMLPQLSAAELHLIKCEARFYGLPGLARVASAAYATRMEAGHGNINLITQVGSQVKFCMHIRT